MGNLLTATAPQASISFAYNALKRLTSVVRSNGISTTYTYDELGRILSITHSSGGITLNSHVYAYDALGNRVSNTTNVAQSLITQAANSTYDAENHLLQSGATSFAHDANGNRVSQTSPTGTTTYVWDSRNRLQSVSTPDGQTTTFTYDFEGSLISQTTTGPGVNVSRTFLLDDLTNVIYQTVNGVGSSILTGRSVDHHLAVLEAGQSIFGLADALNSTAITADQAGTTVARFFYEPFGQTTRSGPDHPFQFTGRMPGPSGLHYYRARYYDPQVGRFLSEDPLEITAGGNPYAYVLNSPTNFTDPFGLQPIPPPPTATPFVVTGGGGLLVGGGGGLSAAFGTGVQTGSAAGPIGALVGINAALFAYDAYLAYKLAQAYGYFLPKPSPARSRAQCQSGRQAKCTPIHYDKKLRGCIYYCDDGMTWFEDGPCEDPLYKPWGEGFPVHPPVPLAP